MGCFYLCVGRAVAKAIVRRVGPAKALPGLAGVAPLDGLQFVQRSQQSLYDGVEVAAQDEQFLNFFAGGLFHCVGIKFGVIVSRQHPLQEKDVLLYGLSQLSGGPLGLVPGLSLGLGGMFGLPGCYDQFLTVLLR